MGSQLTKNYDIEKDPYMTGGLHNLWKVYRGKKKDRNNMDVSIFMFEKKSLEKRKLTQVQKDDICSILKRDPTSLAKFRHPNLLQLIEQPLEDNKIIVFVTEPVEFNLASLVLDANKKEFIPGDLEIKCLTLELLEALNFLHMNAKTIHMNIAPEHIFVTKEGKLKLGGLNFPQQFTTAETLSVALQYDLRVGDLAMVPNLQFASPEISENNQVSIYSDIFSVGCIMYFMVALNKSKLPYLLNLKDITDKPSHSFEINCLDKRFPMLMAGFDNELEQIVRQLTNIKNPQMRGTLQSIVEKSWFQDPLLKTIKFLENLDQKEHNSKVQFLNGITRILEKFDKKALVKKVIPLLLDSMKIPQLSVNVLPSILICMEKPNFLTTTEFREYIWPSISKLCKAKELPAQSLFLILKNTELFLKFVGPQEFQQNFLPLVLKSLECGVAKLQFLALTKIPQISKTIDYQLVKASILPRMLQILEKTPTLQLKIKVLDTVLEIISALDQNTMKEIILKSFEKVRAQENDPQVCMLMLKIYEQMAKVLGVEEIGLKILPGMIPMLIQGTFSRTQFKELITTVRRFLDQIEAHREKDLNEFSQDTPKTQSEDGKAFDFDQLEKSLGMKNETPLSNPTNQDVFDFLNSVGNGSSIPSAQASQGIGSSLNPHNPQDIFAGISSGSTNTQNRTSDPFATAFSQPQVTQQPKQQQQSFSSGWDNDIPNILDFSNNSSRQQQQKPPAQGTDDFFNQIASSTSSQPKPLSQPMTFGGGISSGLSKGGNLSNMNDDPFAELVEGSSSGAVNFKPATFGQNQSVGGGFTSPNSNPLGGVSGFGNQLQKPQGQMGTGAFQGSSQIGTSSLGGGLGGLNFGGVNQQQNNQLNNVFGNSSGGFGGMGQQQNQNLGGFNNVDDFFSQFTNTQQQNQSKSNNQSNFNIFQ